MHESWVTVERRRTNLTVVRNLVEIPATSQVGYHAIKDATLGPMFLSTPHQSSDRAIYSKVLANVTQFMSY